MFWRRLQHVFNVTILCLPRRLEEKLKMKNCYTEDVFKTSCVLKTCLEDVLKTWLEDVLKTSWRQIIYLLGISVFNKSKCVSNKSIFYKPLFDNYETNPKCVSQNPSFQYSPYFGNQGASLFQELKSLMTVWSCNTSWIQIQKVRQQKQFFKQHAKWIFKWIVVYSHI